MERPWAFWRRVEYGAGFLVLLALLGLSLYYLVGYQAPTCGDGKQNGEERGIDCGGVCERICTADTIPLTVSWTQAFRIAEGQYNAVAYVENRNRDSGVPELSYTFKLLDGEGLIAERSGTTVLPPDGVYPIFEGRIATGSRIPTEAVLELSGDAYWREGTGGRDQFSLVGRDLTGADGTPRLVAQVKNNSLDEVEDVEVVATIFDSARRPLTSARTFIENFAGRETEQVTFTWPEPIATNLKSCEIPTDVMLAIDLSGSMNNDGDNPPEPITSVLTAAGTFARELVGEEDQLGLVTYATGASTTETLTRENERVGNVIGGLAIDPKEETGGTNIGEALRRMGEELASSRHNRDARKVAILLTDGVPTEPEENSEAYAISEADALKGMGVLLFTIGLGQGVNEEFLAELASDRVLYHRAPGTGELRKIYSAITESICEDGPTVIEVIAKPGTSFR